jgi:hypothetical protein
MTERMDASPRPDEDSWADKYSFTPGEEVSIPEDVLPSGSEGRPVIPFGDEFMTSFPTLEDTEMGGRRTLTTRIQSTLIGNRFFNDPVPDYD